MLRPRIIPCLLIQSGGLVKTMQFKSPRYLGDPINAVRIFNEKEADELIVLDIDATSELREPDLKMIKSLASECRMPLCYGGGIKTVDQANAIFSLGVEKIALSSAAITNPALITEIAHCVGSQSVVVVLDVKKKIFGGYEIFINNGKVATNINPFEYAKRIEQLGAGEVVINSIDNDGMMKGYDLELVDRIRNSITLPLTVLGGCSKLEDFARLIGMYGIIGAAAGSLFVYKGALKGVLINYPSWNEKNELITNTLNLLMND